MFPSLSLDVIDADSRPPSCRSGTYGVSNHPHDAPYRKSLLGQQIMEEIVETTGRPPAIAQQK